jgi:hypothetical protein
VRRLAKDLLQLAELLLQLPRIRRLHVQAQQRLGVALADVEPPLAASIVMPSR